MFIRIGDDYFNTDHIACIRSVDDGEQTVIFTAGQSSVGDGFLLDVPTDEVFEMIQNVRLHELAAMMETENQDEPEPEPEPAESE